MFSFDQGLLMSPESPEIRRLIARLAGSAKCRRLGWDSQWKLPSDWTPGTIDDPESGMPFTNAGAWNLLAELVEEGHPMEEVRLDVPLGDLAYVLLVNLEGADSTLYIKVQVKGGLLLGRSFHYSEKKGLHGHKRCRRGD